MNQAFFDNESSIVRDDIVNRHAQVIDSFDIVYWKNAPETLCHLAYYNIFSEFLDGVSHDVLPNRA